MTDHYEGGEGERAQRASQSRPHKAINGAPESPESFIERARVEALFIAANRHCQSMTGGSLTDRTGWEVPVDDQCEIVPGSIPSNGKALAMIQYYLEGTI